MQEQFHAWFTAYGIPALSTILIGAATILLRRISTFFHAKETEQRGATLNTVINSVMAKIADKLQVDLLPLIAKAEEDGKISAEELATILSAARSLIIAAVDRSTLASITEALGITSIDAYIDMLAKSIVTERLPNSVGGQGQG